MKFLKIFGFIGRVKRAKKEVDDVIRLARKLSDKYGEVDDDARQLSLELEQASRALREVVGI